MKRGRVVFLIEVALSGAAVDVGLTGSPDRMSPWQRFLLLTWIQPKQSRLRLHTTVLAPPPEAKLRKKKKACV